MATTIAPTTVDRARVAAIARRLPFGTPLPPAFREATARVAAFIDDRFRPDCIVLFVSRVYGDPRIESNDSSDIDLMLIMDAPQGANQLRTEI